VLDKRGQELPCPHCDRIFKQSDRLKQHIQKQHEGAEAGDGDSDDEGSNAAASSSAAPTGPKILAPKAVAAATAAATAAVRSVAAAAAGGQQPGKGSGGASSSSSSAAGGASAAPAAAAGPKLMDVNSKAGYYEAKSPKLLLHEWCLREKVPRPRYRPISAEGGLWKCKVGAHPAAAAELLLRLLACVSACLSARLRP
jgi:ATP-dependent RNA helicase DHX57